MVEAIVIAKIAIFFNDDEIKIRQNMSFGTQIFSRSHARVTLFLISFFVKAYRHFTSAFLCTHGWFVVLIGKCFPPNHKLRKLFNKTNLKLSYSCSPNIKQIIDGHNKTILSQKMPPQEQTPPKPCNCRDPDKCPLKGQSLVKEVVYQATSTTGEST